MERAVAYGRDGTRQRNDLAASEADVPDRGKLRKPTRKIGVSSTRHPEHPATCQGGCDISMSISTCPIATVEAPVEQVWRLRADPNNYGLWWDAETCWQFAMEPAGPAKPGQRITARTRALGKNWARAYHGCEHRPGQTGLGSDDAVTVRHHGTQPHSVWDAG